MAEPASRGPVVSASSGDRGILRALLAAGWQSRARLLTALGLLLAARVASVLVPMALKEIVDLLSRVDQATRLPIVLLIAYALLRFSVVLFSELRDVVFSRVTQRTIANYAQAAFDHLHRMGGDFHVRRRTGALLRDLDRGTNAVGYLMGVALFTALPTLLEILLVQAVMLVRYSNAFAAVMAVTFLVYGLFTFVITARRTTFQRRVNRLDSAAKGRMADSLLNHEAVKYFTNEPLESTRFGRILTRWTEAAVLNQRVLFALHVGQSLIIALGIGAVMLLAGGGVVRGELTVGDLVLINAYVIQICLPLNSLGFVYRETRDALTHTATLFRLLRRPEDLPSPGCLPALRLGKAEIRFEQVGFAYRKGRQVLSDVSFRVPPGTTTAVVGGSGAGKSTLARLLLRLHDPQVGRVLIDGQDLREFDPRSIRALIGVVPQDTSLFNDTLAYNIGYGRPGATQAEIEAAARTAQVHDLIRALPEGYDTVVGERGARLSGGERQRIGIARAVLKDPPLLVFDEATSALDAENERAIQAALAVVARARTTLVIAHRLATVVGADQILVLERGRVVERGTHGALLAARGLYARLWALQDGSDPRGPPEATG